MSSQEKQLEIWLRQQLFRNRKNPIEKLVLKSAAPGSQGQEIEEFSPPEGGWNSDNLPALKDDILSRAQTDADGMGTKLQRYVIIALEMDESRGPRFPFRVKGEGGDDSDGEEAPNDKGIISQLMRHNEVMMRQMTAGYAAQLSYLARQNEMLSNQNQGLLVKQMEGFQALEDAKSQQHQREMELLSVGASEERRSLALGKVVSKIDVLLPAILGKITGSKLLTTGENKALDQFVGSMSEEQLQHLSGLLTQEQKILFMQMMKETSEKKKEE